VAETSWAEPTLPSVLTKIQAMGTAGFAVFNIDSG
jgi:hypothetical protein